MIENQYVNIMSMQNANSLPTDYIALYVRVSTREQAENGYNLEGQKQNTSSFFDKNFKSHFDYKQYEDAGKSARTLERDAIQQLIADIQKGIIKKVVIKKLDRLTRNINDWLYLETLFLQYNVELISLSETIDLKTANGRFQARMFVLLADFEEEQISERVREGLKNGVLQGFYTIGKAPFGYTKNKKTKKLEVNKDERELYFNIIDMVYAGVPTVKIELLINASEYMQRNNKRITAKTIGNMIEKKIYYGVVEIDSKEYAIDVEPFITKSQFEDLNKRFALRKYNNNYHYMFKGFVRCTCGEYMICTCAYGRFKRAYLYYECKRCKYRINENKLARRVVPYLMKHIQTTKSQRNKKSYKTQKQMYNNKINELYNMYLKEKVDFEYFNKLSLELYLKNKEVDENHKRLSDNLDESFHLMCQEEQDKVIAENIKEIVVSNQFLDMLSIQLYEKPKKILYYDYISK